MIHPDAIKRRINSVLVACCLLAGPAGADVFELDVLETDELRLLYFDPFQTYLVPHYVRNFHNSLEFQKKIFGWKPYDDKTLVILTDLRDYGNASAGASPYNSVGVYIAPFNRTMETMPSSERVFDVMNHELVHVATLDAYNSRDQRWRRFFGGKPRQIDKHPLTIIYNYLTTPRQNLPRWYMEGSAVFLETWMAGGVGRAQGAYDEMVFRSMVRDDAYFYSNLGIVSEGVAVDFQSGANAYLYGTRFISYLAFHYSPEQVIEWLSRSEDSERYYSRQFQKVFGKPLEVAWNDWISFEREFQNSNLEKVRQHRITPTTPLAKEPLGSISRSYIDVERKEMIGAFQYPGVVAHVGVLSLADGSLRRVTDIKGPMTYRVTSSAWDPETRTFFYTADNKAYRDLMAVNIDTGDSRMLLKDARVGDIVFDSRDRSLWGLRHLNGYVSLVHIPYPYHEWNQVFTWPYGEVPFELDISPDGELMSMSFADIDGSQLLQIVRIEDLLAGTPTPVAKYDFRPAVPEGFVFSDDGKYLYGSSFYTGISNIFRFELETGELEAVSNAESGFFRPVPLQDGSLMVFEYTGQGFLPSIIDAPRPLDDVSAITFLGAEIAAKHPIVQTWSVAESLGDIDFDERVTHKGKYRPYRELGYESAYPVIEGYRGTEAVGWRFQFADPAMLNQVNVTASYSLNGDLPSDEKTHFELEYDGLHWYAKYWHNLADFYDLFGPTERSRKGDAYILGYDRALIYDDPRELDLKSSLAYYTGLDALPSNQNVSTAAIDRILALDLGLHYTHTRSSIGHVDHEKGFRWDLVLEATDSDLDTVIAPRVGLDFGFALPWKHSSIWFYNALGTTNGERSDPLGNHYFGGFGNNYVDDGEVKRYREYSSFPGFEIDEIIATDFVKSVAEWNLPPIRFREVGKPSFFLGHIRPALFFGALVADPGEPFERTVTTAGAQLDLEFTLVHLLPMTFSIGYALGFEDGRRQNDEWMISLKIL